MPTPSGPSTTPSDADRLRLRSLEAGDAERLVDGFAHLSLESRHLRYFYPKKRLSPAEVDQLTHPDHRDHEAVAAFSHESGVLLGVARFVREPDDPSVASITAIVGDRFQGHGIGSALLREVAARARQAGVQRLRADILAENRRMLQLAFRLWPAHRTVHRGLGVVEVEFDLTAGGAHRIPAAAATAA